MKISIFDNGKRITTKEFSCIPNIGDKICSTTENKIFVVKRIEWIELDNEFYPEIYVSSEWRSLEELPEINEKVLVLDAYKDIYIAWRTKIKDNIYWYSEFNGFIDDLIKYWMPIPSI